MVISTINLVKIIVEGKNQRKEKKNRNKYYQHC